MSTGLSVTTTGSSSGAALASDTTTADPTGNYTLKITGLTDPTAGGFSKSAFNVNDLTTGVKTNTGGDPYSGPVANLSYQYINITPDNLNITGGLPGAFIRSGNGVDAIDVSTSNGTNVLDGGTNSNFLVGGKLLTGFDTFFVDDRGPGSDIWSTMVNFHTGDAATVFGLTQGSGSQWVANQGAAGYTGLTLHAVSAGAPTASLTLSGYGLADLSNGKLTSSFGTESDGTPYFYVKAN